MRKRLIIPFQKKLHEESTRERESFAVCPASMMHACYHHARPFIGLHRSFSRTVPFQFSPFRRKFYKGPPFGFGGRFTLGDERQHGGAVTFHGVAAHVGNNNTNHQFSSDNTKQQSIDTNEQSIDNKQNSDADSGACPMPIFKHNTSVRQNIFPFFFLGCL